MCKPEKWGNGYYMNEKFIAFIFENGMYVEMSYMNPPKEYVYSKYQEDQVEIVKDFN